MNDDLDPVVSDALRHLAESAPQPRGDRVQAVIAGVRRRQRRVMGASAISIVALVAGTALGVQSLRGTGSADSTPPGSSHDPAPSRQGPSPVGNTPTPPSPSSGSPTASASSASSRHTASQPRSAHPLQGEPKPSFSLQVSPTQVVAGGQLRATVTIVNAGTATLAPSDFGIGTMIPNDSFDAVPQACTSTPALGGADCPVAALRPGQKASFAFVVTLMASPLDYDNIFATLKYTDGHGRSQQAQAGQRVDVVGGGGPPSPPSSGVPHSPTPSSS